MDTLEYSINREISLPQHHKGSIRLATGNFVMPFCPVKDIQDSYIITMPPTSPKRHPNRLPARESDDPSESNEITPLPTMATAATNPKPAAALLLDGEASISIFLSVIKVIKPIANKSSNERINTALQISESRKKPSPLTLKQVSQILAAPPIMPRMIIGSQSFLIFIKLFSFKSRIERIYLLRCDKGR